MSNQPNGGSSTYTGQKNPYMTEDQINESLQRNEDAINQRNEAAQNDYTVQKGDTLSEIAVQHNKTGGQFMSVEALAILNGISNPNLIHTGDELTLTVDPAIVADSITKIEAVISLAEELKNSSNGIKNFGLHDSGGELDTEASTLATNLATSADTVIKNATLYKDWLVQLDTALKDTELWATNVIDSNTMFGISNIE